jgi:signal transduction histidine kinase
VPTLMLRRLSAEEGHAPEWVVTVPNTAARDLLGADGGRTLADVFRDTPSAADRLRGHLNDPEGVLEALELNTTRGARPVRPRVVRQDDRAILYLEERFELTEQRRALQAEATEGRQRAKMQALGNLASGIAHEFNNILAGLMGFAELALERSLEGEVATEEVREVLAASARAKRLVHRILLFGRRRETERQRLNLNDVLLGLKEFLAQALPPNIRVQWRLSAGPLWIDGDRDAIEHCLLNLATNGRDAMPSGGVLVVQTRRVGDRVHWEVADDGVGMDDETIRRAREPFFTRKAPGAGTGLGLPSVESAVQSLGGTLHIDSAPGQGTRVHIELPYTEVTDSGRNVREVRFEPEPKDCGRILVVDDEPMIRRSVERILELDGHDVVVASTAEDAWQQMQDASFDVVVLDLELPGVGGYALLQRVQQAYSGQKVLVVSGEGEALESVRSAQYPGVQVLPKPFGRTELLREIHLALFTSAA